jgi:hypothetical protein
MAELPSSSLTTSAQGVDSDYTSSGEVSPTYSLSDFTWERSDSTIDPTLKLSRSKVQPRTSLFQQQSDQNSQQQHETFVLFPDFPLEIQLMIFDAARCALSRTRTIGVISHKDHPCGKMLSPYFIYEGDAIDNRECRTPTRFSNAALLYVNQASRKEMKKHYKIVSPFGTDRWLWEAHQLSPALGHPSPYEQPYAYFNFERDNFDYDTESNLSQMSCVGTQSEGLVQVQLVRKYDFQDHVLHIILHQYVWGAS